MGAGYLFHSVKDQGCFSERRLPAAISNLNSKNPPSMHLCKVSFNIWPNCLQVQRKVSLQSVFQTCLKALRVTTCWSAAKGLKPVGNPTLMDFLNLTVRSEFKTQHKLHNQLEKKLTIAICFRKHPRNRLSWDSWKTLDAITDYIWLPWLKHTFRIWLLGWSCPVDWAPKRWDRAKGFDQTSNRTLDIIDISLHLLTSSHCMSLHHQTNKFIVEHSTRKSDTNPLNKARLIKCYRLALRTKFHKHKLATAKSHEIIPNAWTSTSSRDQCRDHALSHAQTLTCNRGWPVISISNHWIAFHVSTPIVSGTVFSSLSILNSWSSHRFLLRCIVHFLSLHQRFSSCSKGCDIGMASNLDFSRKLVANVGTWRDFTGRAMASFCKFMVGSCFTMQVSKAHCHCTPIWLRSPRGGDENLTFNEN